MKAQAFLCFLTFSLVFSLKTLEFKDFKAPGEEQSTRIWMGWIVRESGADGFRQVNGDRGNAFGKYQFDRRYGLVPFMQSCRNFNPTRYAKFQKFIDMGAGSEQLKGNQELASVWLSYCDAYPEEFEKLQDIDGYRAYYLEVKKYLMNLYGINLDNHTPALRGSAFSMSIRSGALSAARKFVGLNDQTSELTMLEQSYGSYGTEDAQRWTKALQYGDALYAREIGDFQVIPTDMAAEAITLPRLIKAKTAINRRSTPDSSRNDNIVGYYSTDSIIQVNGKTGGWYLDYQNTYITANTEYIIPSIYGTCTADSLNVRSSPQSTSSVVGYCANGDKVQLYKNHNGFYYIRMKRGGFGWASQNYIKLN